MGNKIIESIGALLVCMVISSGLIWARQRINAKVQADQDAARAQQAVAASLRNIDKELFIISEIAYAHRR
jgi:hypothetical protein